MFLKDVKPRLQAMTGVTIESRRLHFVGIGESQLQERIRDLMSQSQPTVAPYAKWGEVEVRVTAKAKDRHEAASLLEPVVQEIRERVGSYLYGEGDISLEEAVVRRFLAAGRTVAVAESATGGWISQRLTSIPGASKVLKGSWVVYTETAKEVLLDVPHALLIGPGPVSSEVTSELAQRARSRLSADVGLATTGWAGPDGDGPVGSAYVAVCDEEGPTVRSLTFSGSRNDVRHRICQEALRQLWMTARQEG